MSLRPSACITLILVLFTSCFLSHENPKGQVSKQHKSPEPDSILQVVAFGSCSRQYFDQPIWLQVLKNDPDLWIWLGDIIYSDTEDMDQKKSDYQEAKLKPEYQQFIKHTPVVAVWDDHDFGANDAGSEYPKKKQSRDLLFEFLDLDKSDRRWSREGAYASYEFGEDSKKVKLILLDSRYFRDAIIKKQGVYVPNYEGDILGEKQWEWFENELQTNQAEITIIGNGIQFISEEHKYEKWANFPKSRERLFDLLNKYYRKNIVLISGDRHIAEISSVQIGEESKLYEVTSSGLTHSFESMISEPNKHRISKLINSKNFALLKFDWSEPGGRITVEVRGDNNELLVHQNLEY